jgi:hypothetical protein
MSDFQRLSVTAIVDAVNAGAARSRSLRRRSTPSPPTT